MLNGKLPSPQVTANSDNTYLFPLELRLALTNKKSILETFKYELGKKIRSALENHESSGRVTAIDGSENTDRL